jgi:transposase InsO family protein
MRVVRTAEWWRRRAAVPWKETRVVDERIGFIAALREDPRCNFSRLCERFGISRSQGYKWVRRYEALGAAGLEDKKPIATTCPHRTPDPIHDLVVALRKEHPFDGPKKLRTQLLEAHPELVIPAASTIGDIVKRAGLVRPRRARLRVPPSSSPLGEATSPNTIWCADFKGHFAVGDGTRCYPLTISDACTRYLVKCEGMTEPRGGPVRAHFERAFVEFGLPEKIRTDHGPPFASKALGGLSSLQVWWIRLGIVPERIEPGHPEQNGRHERMHRTLKEQTASPPKATMAEQQRCFDFFRADYNDRRPHEALGQKPPARCYEPSLRALPAQPSDPEYGDDFVIRRIASGGTFSWKGESLYVGPALGGQPVGLKQIDDDEWELFYGPLLIGAVLSRDGKVRVQPRA